MPAASSPGSDAFYRRSLRKGSGGDAEGTAMRANLSFQHSLRHGDDCDGTPDGNTLSQKRSRRSGARSARGHVTTPTDAEVDALLTRLANGSPSLLGTRRDGSTPPKKPPWSPPKVTDVEPRNRGNVPAWPPVEAMMPPAQRYTTGERATTPGKQGKSPRDFSRAIHFTTPGDVNGGIADAALHQDNQDNQAETRLPVFARLAKQSPRHFGKDLSEKRREIFLLRAELAAREVAEAAGAANAAPAVAAEMARMGGGLRTMGMSNYSGQSANPTQKVMSPANSSTDAREHAILAQQELAARDALERILATPSAFGSPSGLIRPRSQSPFVAATSPYLSTRKTTTPVNAAAYTDFDWRFTGDIGGSPGRKKPWNERQRVATQRRLEKATALELAVWERREKKNETEKLVRAAENELERLRKRRLEIVTRTVSISHLPHSAD